MSSDTRDLENLLQIVDPSGTVLKPELLPSHDVLLKQYRAMRRIRHFDDRAHVLFRQGRLGAYPYFSGQEASLAGTALCLTPQDWLAPSYRETGAALVYGMSIEHCLMYWRTSPHGFKMPEHLRCLPFYIPIATQLPQAVGCAMAEKLKKTNHIAMGFIGDGGSSEGDFHTALNFAGALNAPVVFVVQNNGWAISVPISKQTKAVNLSSRAEGYGIVGERVDGNDIVAVHHVTQKAVERARRGEGPTLIETLTYRVRPHTTADDPSRYRTENLTAEWQAKDPLKRSYALLESLGLWDEDKEQALLAELTSEYEAALHKADHAPEPAPEEIVDHVFATPTPALQAQRRAIQEEYHG